MKMLLLPIIFMRGTIANHHQSPPITANHHAITMQISNQSPSNHHCRIENFVFTVSKCGIFNERRSVGCSLTSSLRSIHISTCNSPPTGQWGEYYRLKFTWPQKTRHVFWHEQRCTSRPIGSSRDTNLSELRTRPIKPHTQLLCL